MPMDNNGGRDIRLLRNPATGAFDQFDWDATGNPVFDDSDEHVVLSCVYETSYWANPQRGSKIPDVKLDRTGTDNELQAAGEGALKYPLDNGQIKSAEVSAQKLGAGRYSLIINYRNRDGHRQNTRLPIGS
jgi:phage gp46-like protein